MTPEVLAELTSAVRIEIRQARRLYPWLDPDAVESAAWFGAVKAARSYEPGTAGIQTYARFRIRGQIHDDARAWSKFRQHRDRPGRSLQFEPLPEDDDPRFARLSSDQPHDARIIARLTVTRLMHRAKLDQRDLRIIQAYFFEDVKIEDVARELGLHPSRVPQLMKKIARRMRRASSVNLTARFRYAHNQNQPAREMF